MQKAVCMPQQNSFCGLV